MPKVVKKVEKTAKKVINSKPVKKAILAKKKTSKHKDFFIPHAGNNYHPHALKVKRIVFHAMAAFAVKAIVVFFVISYPLLAWMTPDVVAGENQKIIAQTNELRTSLSLKPLSENFKLDMAASKKVEDMFINQYFAHVSPQGLDLEHFLALAGYKDYVIVGENLAMGYDNTSEAMNAWKKSPTHYANLIDENYSQIGVAIAGGTYSDTETVFAAQYFALPESLTSDNATASTIAKSVTQSLKTGEKNVLGEKTQLTIATPKKLAVAPILTREQAKITVSTPAGKTSTKVVKVEVVLPSETKSAVAQVENNNIVLLPVATSSVAVAAGTIATPSENLWVGQEVVSGHESGSAVPPVILATDNAGQTAQVMVNSDSIKPTKTSILDQYFLYKTNPNNGLAQILDISSIYFKILLGFALLILALNIFIEIKKQHHKPILSGVGLIMLLLLFIAF